MSDPPPRLDLTPGARYVALATLREEEVKPLSFIEIITIGDELVEGRLVDTNAGWLSDRLGLEGFSVVRHTSVGDDRAVIVEALRQAAERSDAVIVTGGLGPTTDDLTAECAAEAFHQPVVRFEEALEHVKRYYASRNRVMSPVNAKQADLPAHAQILPNPWGTAVGFEVDAGRCRLYFMPGVPREMYGIFGETVLPDLRARLTPQPSRVASLRIFGLGESNVGELLQGLEGDAPAGTALTIQYRASFPEIQVRLVLKGAPDAPTDAGLQPLLEEAHRRLARYVYAHGIGSLDTSLAEVVLEDARRGGAQLAVAESCTGGLLGALLTAIPGSSDVFRGGVVAYHNDAKVALLGVPPELLAEHGAVSGPVAEAMASGARQRLGATHAVSITGIAGPGGGTPDKPVGTVWIGLAGPEGVRCRAFHFPLERERVRLVSAWTALGQLRRALTSTEGG